MADDLSSIIRLHKALLVLVTIAVLVQQCWAVVGQSKDMQENMGRKLHLKAT